MQKLKINIQFNLENDFRFSIITTLAPSKASSMAHRRPHGPQPTTKACQKIYINIKNIKTFAIKNTSNDFKNHSSIKNKTQFNLFYQLDDKIKTIIRLFNFQVKNVCTNFLT